MLGLRLSVPLLLAAACLLLRAGFSSASLSTKTVVTCDSFNNIHHLSCDSGVISVQTALYGRTNTETCSEGRPQAELNNTMCSLQGTMGILKASCDGKKVCEININSVRTSDPCLGIFKYLQTNYTCIPATRSVTCQDSVANLQCGEGQLIFVLSSNYGRRDRTTCFSKLTKKTENTNCLMPTTKVAESCNGKSSCYISASSSVFGDPCVGTYKYLEVAYTCRDTRAN